MRYLIFLIFISCNTSNEYIIKVHDGDTFYSRSGMKIRLSDADCPEIGQTYGYEAKKYVESLILNKTVSVTKIKNDKYGRSVCKVYIDNNSVTEMVIKNGFGWAYSKYCKDSKLLQEQDYARQNRLGLWAYPYISPYQFRKHKQ